jgi:hypothetical protein
VKQLKDIKRIIDMNPILAFEIIADFFNQNNWELLETKNNKTEVLKSIFQ